MTPHLISTSLCAALLLGGLTTSIRAISPADLSRKLAAGEKVFLIDVRPSARFATGSIPGAMSIPAAIVLAKKLPPLSPAVLFDDGLGRIDVAALAATLNQRPGWKAEVLEGGFSAWSALPGASQTSPTGLHQEPLQQITYDDLAALKENVVLVDLRPVDPAPTSTTAKAAPGKRSASASAPDPVAEFCGKAANRSYLGNLGDFRRHFKPASRQQAKPGRPAPVKTTAAAAPPLVVLVDAVGADHRETVRRLRAEGYSRILVLAGGDETILLQGRRGKGRISGALGEGILADPTPQPQPAKP